MDKTTFEQLYDTFSKSGFQDESLYTQLTLIVCTHPRAVATFHRPKKGWEGVVMYFLEKGRERGFICKDKVSGKWGPVRQNVIVPHWDNEELLDVLADPGNTVLIPFFNFADVSEFCMNVL